MRIAICDDDIKELNSLSKLLNDYREKRKVSLIYMIYSDGFALLEDVRKGGFDFLLLDVMMPLVNGMEIAHEVREFDEDIKLAFLTSSPEFAVESYSVEAFGYLLKPATEDNLFPLLDKFYRLSQKPEIGLIVKLQNGVAKLPFSKIAYVEVLNRMLFFHLTDGSIKKLIASLSEYEDTLLQRPEFIKVHRSYIVNLWQIQELRPTDIQTYSGDIVPVSRRLYAQVRTAYMDHLFEDNRTI
jgi:DNA-binding LytR/AlgR family response regulator